VIHSFAAALRRQNRMMRPAANLGRATRSFHKDMTGFMIGTALAPLAAFQPKKTKPRKAPAAKTGRTLGATLRQLRAAQAFAPGAMAGASGREETPGILKGARYLAQTHRSAAGSRGYKLYLPASEPKRPRGLILRNGPGG